MSFHQSVFTEDSQCKWVGLCEVSRRGRVCAHAFIVIALLVNYQSQQQGLMKSISIFCREAPDKGIF
jgi:hypothetical protein